MDGPSILKFIDLLDDNQLFRNLIILQSVWAYVKKMNSAAFKKLHSIYSESGDRIFVFLNEFIAQTFVEPSTNRVPEL